MEHTRLQGVIVPMLTPLSLDGSQLAVDAIPSLVEFLIGGGVHALFLAGTTSEGPLLSVSERRTLLERTVEAVDDRVPVVLHVGAAATRDAVGLAAFAADAGASAIASVTPYYYAYGRDELSIYFREVAGAAPNLPMYLYSIPARTAHHIGADLALELAEVPNIVGIKDSTGDMQMLLSYLEVPGFTVLSGSDILAGAALTAGSHGIVSGLAGVIPQPFVELWNAHRDGDEGRMQRAYRTVLRVATALGYGSKLSLLKALASERIAASATLQDGPASPTGPLLGAARSPHPAALPAEVTQARDALAALVELGALGAAGPDHALRTRGDSGQTQRG
ncbi:MAG: dihydrodipicolinate synthase family protein [Deinococcales bacterium]